MPKNIVNDLFDRLSLETTTKNNCIIEILSFQRGLLDSISLFGKEKIDNILVSDDTITDIEKPFIIINNLLSYKYRLTHNGSNNSKYNVFNQEKTDELTHDIDNCITFVLSILFKNHTKLKNNFTYGNSLVRICLNECLNVNDVQEIKKRMSDLKTNKDVLSNIYWINMPLGKLQEFITPNILNSFTIADLIMVKRHEDDMDDWSDTLKAELDELMKPIQNLINQNEKSNKPTKKYGVVFYELLSMKLDEEKLELPFVAYFLKKGFKTNLFNNRGPLVSSFIQQIAFKIKSHLSSDELDKINKKNQSSQIFFEAKKIMELSLLKTINRGHIDGLLASSILRDNADSGLKVAQGLMQNYVDEPVSFKYIYTLANKTSDLITYRMMLSKLDILVEESDFLEMLVDKQFRSESNRKFINDWALEYTLDKEIPMKSGPSKVIKF